MVKLLYQLKKWLRKYKFVLKQVKSAQMENSLSVQEPMPEALKEFSPLLTDLKPTLMQVLL
jgi:hypothetical protein